MHGSECSPLKEHLELDHLWKFKCLDGGSAEPGLQPGFLKVGGGSPPPTHASWVPAGLTRARPSLGNKHQAQSFNCVIIELGGGGACLAHFSKN